MNLFALLLVTALTLCQAAKVRTYDYHDSKGRPDPYPGWREKGSGFVSRDPGPRQTGGAKSNLHQQGSSVKDITEFTSGFAPLAFVVIFFGVFVYFLSSTGSMPQRTTMAGVVLLGIGLVGILSFPTWPYGWALSVMGILMILLFRAGAIGFDAPSPYNHHHQVRTVRY